MKPDQLGRSGDESQPQEAAPPEISGKEKIIDILKSGAGKEGHAEEVLRVKEEGSLSEEDLGGALKESLLSNLKSNGWDVAVETFHVIKKTLKSGESIANSKEVVSAIKEAVVYWLNRDDLVGAIEIAKECDLPESFVESKKVQDKVVEAIDSRINLHRDDLGYLSEYAGTVDDINSAVEFFKIPELAVRSIVEQAINYFTRHNFDRALCFVHTLLACVIKVILTLDWVFSRPARSAWCHCIHCSKYGFSFLNQERM